ELKLLGLIREANVRSSESGPEVDPAMLASYLAGTATEAEVGTVRQALLGSSALRSQVLEAMEAQEFFAGAAVAAPAAAAAAGERRAAPRPEPAMPGFIRRLTEALSARLSSPSFGLAVPVAAALVLGILLPRLYSFSPLATGVQEGREATALFGTARGTAPSHREAALGALGRCLGSERSLEPEENAAAAREFVIDIVGSHRRRLARLRLHAA